MTPARAQMALATVRNSLHNGRARFPDKPLATDHYGAFRRLRAGSPPFQAQCAHRRRDTEHCTSTSLLQAIQLHAMGTRGSQRSLTKEVAMSESGTDFLFGTSTGNGRVMVVDDEPDIRKVVRMTLQKAGYDVLEAEDGEKAIEVINTGENRLMLDVIICDIRMPKINGVEAIEYLRKEYPNVQLIVLTGFPDMDMASSFLRQGVVDYLVKPVSGEKLRDSVAKAMDQREIHRL